MPVLLTGVFMAALDTAIIGPAIPVLRSSFGIDNREVGLVMTVFILISLSSTALMANLSDRHGRRRIYLASVSCFALGSLLIALSPGFGWLLAGRAVQGLGAGGIVPSASALIGERYSGEQRARALGLIGAVYGMAFVLGPPLASVLMVALSWHWIFLLNLPIAALIVWMGLRALPRHGTAGAAAQAPLDWPGIALVFASLSCLVLGMTRHADAWLGLQLWPWLLLLALALLPVLAWVERRAASPMIPPALFASRQLRRTWLLGLGAGLGMGSVVFLSSIATLAHGVAPRHAGFVLLPLVLCSMLGSMGSGRLLQRQGPRRLLLAGFVLLGLGYAASVPQQLGLAGFLLATLPVGLGVGIVVGGALRTIAIDDAPPEARTSAQGLINICSAIGSLLAAALVSAIADLRGGDPAAGFALAYGVVAGLMGLMALLALGLRRREAQAAPAAAPAPASTPT